MSNKFRIARIVKNSRACIFGNPVSKRLADCKIENRVKYLPDRFT
ncbi:hypothetical protein Tco_0264306, partial [Tanacetum coccineum]